MTRVGGRAGQTEGTQSRKHSCRHFLLCGGPLGAGWEGPRRAVVLSSGMLSLINELYMPGEG